jgi:PTH1 family peptidyl-tRNA hydrolase
MKLVVGLGNPGRKYKKTKHNVGFIALDFYAKKYNLQFKVDNKFSGEWLKIDDLILLKPHTFMNLSGESIRKIMQFFDVQIENVILIYDDLSLPFGKIRLREKGSAAGHNGVKSAIQNMKTDEFKRLKFGIDRNPLIEQKDYVLSKFSKEELKDLEEKVEIISNIIDDFKNNIEFTKIMTKYN